MEKLILKNKWIEFYIYDDSKCIDTGSIRIKKELNKEYLKELKIDVLLDAESIDTETYDINAIMNHKTHLTVEFRNIELNETL